MRRMVLLLLFVFVVFGCEMPEDTAMEMTEETDVLVEESSSLPEESSVALEETIETTSEEIKVEAIVLAKKEEMPISRTAEEIIKENRWGFSIYDPETGTIEYYASKGGYLGKKSIQ